MENGFGAISLVEILSECEKMKFYWHQKESIGQRDGILYRQTSEKIEQTLVLRFLQENFRELAHTGKTGVTGKFGGHIGRCGGALTG